MLYHGLEVLAGGAILGGLVLGAIAVFIIERKFVEAAAFAAAGAVLTFFGFMHGEAVGFAVTPSVAFAYAIVAAFLFALSRMPAEVSAPGHGTEGGAGRIGVRKRSPYRWIDHNNPSIAKFIHAETTGLIPVQGLPAAQSALAPLLTS